jgi:hypothetical protein
MSNENKNHISWEAWEFRHYPKTFGWYVALVSVFVLLIAFFVLVESDIFAAVTLGIVGILIIFFSRQTPLRVNVQITGKGVHFGNLFYPYKQIKYFWVVHNDRHQTLNFHTSAFVNNVLILELEDQNPDHIRDFLLQYLPEHSETQETTVQKIMHKFNF